MADVLENILDVRRKSLKEAKDKAPLYQLEKKAEGILINSLASALLLDSGISVISEMKRKSPSAGLLREPYDVVEIAAAYKKGGAKALSVLTEPDFFGGDLADMGKARDAAQLPILRKDFIFDPYQIIEAKAHGADAVLLIADILSGSQAKELVDCANEIKIDTLIEVFTSDVLPVAINSGSKLIGINNRNLRTLEMNTNNAITLSRMIPKDRAVVAESGIKTKEDIQKLVPLPISAVLVGESILKQDDLAAGVQNLAEAGKR